jgi:diadenosine tetraphosphate (Ap4A) HIT family hydrolase
VAERQPLEPAFFTIRDASPNKPDRWLALPRFHGQSPQELSAMTAEQRTRYWTVAIAKANQVWGDAWGIAVNSLERRSQCHMHMHIGKLKSGAEDGQFVVVSGPGEIPLPRPNDGIWIHPVLGKFHAHWGDSGPELKLEP